MDRCRGNANTRYVRDAPVARVSAPGSFHPSRGSPVPRLTSAAINLARFALCAALQLAATETAAQGAPAPRSPAPAAQTCTASEISRTPLVVNGQREMYIEPTAVLPSRGEILLAGSPNFLHPPAGPSAAARFVQDSVFGAIVGSD